MASYNSYLCMYVPRMLTPYNAMSKVMAVSHA